MNQKKLKDVALPSLALAVILAFFSAPQPALAGPLPLLKGAPEPQVLFKAIGRPSALKIEGKSQALSSQLALEKNELKGSVELSLATLETGLALRDRHMKEKYLEVEKHPITRLEISPIQLPASLLGAPGGSETVKIPGQLTLHGVTKPVEAQATLTRKEQALQVQASLALKLPDYGIEIPKFAGITVAEDVTIDVTFSLTAP